MAFTVVIGEAAHTEKGSGHYGYDGSTKGDQLQKHKDYTVQTPLNDYRTEEVRINSWYNKPWRHIYRPTDERVREGIAIRTEQTVRNPHIGYSQPGRLGFYNAMMKDPDPSHITTDIECDCSSMVNSIVYVTLKSVGITPDIKGTEVTSQMAIPYKKMCEKGIFEDIIGNVNLKTGEGVCRGCILLGDPATHTATVISTSETKTYSTEPKFTGEVYGCVRLNVRTGAGITYPIYNGWRTLSIGNLVAVCDEENGWYYVRISGDGYCHYAWVNKNYIREFLYKERKGVIDGCLALHLREKPINGKILRYMLSGKTVTIKREVTAENGAKWYFVKYGEVEGYASAKYIKVE